MVEPFVWGRSRSVIFVIVLALHLVLVALIATASRTRLVASVEQPVHLLSLPPTKLVKVRAENLRPQRESTDVAAALAPPAFYSALQLGPSSGPDGRGPAVNWAAEAHRAVRAFEIRRDQPANSARSVSSPPEEWPQHRAGEQVKTENGDWIVWIDANCYQIATWHSNARTLDASPPRTICPAENVRSHGGD